jgi:hypothetical protein
LSSPEKYLPWGDLLNNLREKLIDISSDYKTGSTVWVIEEDQQQNSKPGVFQGKVIGHRRTVQAFTVELDNDLWRTEIPYFCMFPSKEDAQNATLC